MADPTPYDRRSPMEHERDLAGVLSPDAEKRHAPEHFGRALTRWLEDGAPEPTGIEPVTKPGKRKAAARRNRKEPRT